MGRRTRTVAMPMLPPHIGGCHMELGARFG
jgi:hypothetical protein